MTVGAVGLAEQGTAARTGVLGLLVLAVAGTALRFALLSHQSFWYDEVVSTHLAQASLADILAGRSRDLGNPPLHLVLLHLWMAVFGNGDAAARAMSAVAGAASIPIFFLVARRLLSGQAALLATAIFAVSPAQIYFAQEARTYTLVTLLSLSSMAFLLRATDVPRRVGSWVGFGLMTFLAMYAHYFAIFVVMAQGLWLLTAQRERRVLIPAVASLVGAGLLYAAVWLPSLMQQMGTKGNLGRAADTWHLQVLSTPLVFAYGTTLLWKDTKTLFRIATAGVGLIAFAGAALVGIRALRQQRTKLTLVLAWFGMPVLLPLIISATLAPFYYVRYGLIAAPAYYMLTAAGLLRLKPNVRAWAAGTIGAAMVASLAFYFTGLVKHDWREAAAWAAAKKQHGDVYAFDADIGETSFAHYSSPDPTRIRLLEPPAGSPAATYWGTSPRKEPGHSVAPELMGARRVVFVFSDPQSGTGNYYRKLFENGWRRLEGRAFRGIDIGLYEHL